MLSESRFNLLIASRCTLSSPPLTDSPPLPAGWLENVALPARVPVVAVVLGLVTDAGKELMGETRTPDERVGSL